MASISRFLITKLRLKVNESKSAVARPEERKFLGFSISNDGRERRIAPKALERFKRRVRELTRRTRGASLAKLTEDLTPYLLGWRGYFGFCETPRVLANLDACEADPARAQQLNTEVPRKLAQLVARGGARLLHVSTDAVFDGKRPAQSGGYHEDDSPNPIGVKNTWVLYFKRRKALLCRMRSASMAKFWRCSES